MCPLQSSGGESSGRGERDPCPPPLPFAPLYFPPCLCLLPAACPLHLVPVPAFLPHALCTFFPPLHECACSPLPTTPWLCLVPPSPSLQGGWRQAVWSSCKLYRWVSPTRPSLSTAQPPSHSAGHVLTPLQHEPL